MGNDTGNDTGNETLPTRRSPVWMRVLLVVSLGLNLAVVGVVVGAKMRGFGPGGPPHAPSMGSAMIRALPSEDRREIGTRARAQMASANPGPREGRPGRIGLDTLVQALRADPYDHAAVAAMIAAQGQERRGWAEAMQAAWLVQVQEMTEAERAAYAQALEVARDRQKDRRKRWKDKPRPD